jgi:hypothetical protein
MTTPHDLTFADIDATLRLFGDVPLIDLIHDVLPGWPFAVSDVQPETPAFFTIASADGEPQYQCLDMTTEGAKPRVLDGVNAVCDLIAAMSRALPAAQPSLICLHAAAIEISGRLIVIPNARRAGKSTLVSYMAHLGYSVFTDDFLAVSFDENGSLVGRANGISPRLRLPLPDALPDEFKTWAHGLPGASNKQYKYLSIDATPASGITLPLGAIVLLDRKDDARADFRDVSPDSAMDALLHQNFTRDIHSGGVLGVMERLMATLPVKELCYANAQDAAAMLTENFGTWDAPVATSEAYANNVFDRAELLEPLVGSIRPDISYSQNPNASVATIGDAIYLSDAKGAGIHRLNPVSRAIWLLLEEPSTPDQIVDILQFTFPKVPNSNIRTDTEKFLQRLARAGLIVATAK